MAKKQSTKFFNQAEAQGRIGQHIRTLIELPGVSRGTEGTVVNASEAIQGNSQYRLVIEWNMSAQPLPFNNQVLAAIAGGYSIENIGRSARQQFNKLEYERYLWEIDPPK